MAKTVAIANQKGGVGKTTTAVNLSACVAQLGKRVLAIDIDPQGNMTSGLGVDKDSVAASIYDLLINRTDAREAIIGTHLNWALLPEVPALFPNCWQQRKKLKHYITASIKKGGVL